MTGLSDAAKQAWGIFLGCPGDGPIRFSGTAIEAGRKAAFDELARLGLIEVWPRTGDDYRYGLTEKGREQKLRDRLDPVAASHNANAAEVRSLVGEDDGA